MCCKNCKITAKHAAQIFVLNSPLTSSSLERGKEEKNKERRMRRERDTELGGFPLSMKILI
jgi:hypothetical protein